MSEIPTNGYPFNEVSIKNGVKGMHESNYPHIVILFMPKHYEVK